MAQSPANIDRASLDARTDASPLARRSTTAFRSSASRMDAPEMSVIACLTARLRVAFETSRFRLCWRAAKWGLAAID
jgi:hypothetical protein